MYTKKKSKKNYTLWDMLKYEAKQFCLYTALHGYRFIVLPKRILLERVFWIIIVLLSLAAAVSLLCLAYINFQENPTILVTDSTHYPIWNYPFPAITICDFNKISKTKVETLVKNLDIPYKVPLEEVIEDFRLLVQLIYNSNENIPLRNYTRLQDILDTNDLTIERVMETITPKCNDMLQRCKWKGEEKRCESIFEPIKTTEGFCCSFNYLALRNHTFGGVLANKVPTYPRRVSACGYLTALEVLVNSQPEDYFATHIAAVGRSILIHSSFDFPDWSMETMLTERKINHLIGVTPTITYSTPSIFNLAQYKRKCLFNNESYLHNFAQYNFHNCMVECKMNLTKKLCNCIQFYYHHESGTYPKTRICNLRDISCLREHRHIIMSTTPGFDPSSAQIDHNWEIEEHLCSHCMSDCDYVDYTAESSSGVFTRKFSSNQQNLFGNIVIEHQSVVRVYFNDLVATKNRRDVAFSWHTLLAFYGGLLGLFIGFSFVSVVELIYFFTIRLVLDTKQHNEVSHKKTETKNKVPINVKPHQEEISNPKNLILNQYHNRHNLRRRSNSNS